MKPNSNILILLFVLSIIIVSCKKKKEEPFTLPEPTCLLTYIESSIPSYVSNAYTYNSNNLTSSFVIDNGSTVTTTNYTYTYDADNNVIKRDQGSGTYTIYEYSAGKLSGYTEYTSNTAGYSYTITYSTGKANVNMYSSTGNIYNVTEYTFTGDNLTTQKDTMYDNSGNVSMIRQSNYSNFDDKYSVSHVRSKNDPIIRLSASKNNNATTTYSQTGYNASGTVTYTMTGSYETTYTCNSSGVPTRIVTNYYSNYNGSISNSSSTSDLTYSNCN
jgi:hypothetical protein